MQSQNSFGNVFFAFASFSFILFATLLALAVFVCVVCVTCFTNFGFDSLLFHVVDVDLVRSLVVNKVC